MLSEPILSQLLNVLKNLLLVEQGVNILEKTNKSTVKFDFVD